MATQTLVRWWWGDRCLTTEVWSAKRPYRVGATVAGASRPALGDDAASFVLLQPGAPMQLRCAPDAVGSVWRGDNEVPLDEVVRQTAAFDAGAHVIPLGPRDAARLSRGPFTVEIFSVSAPKKVARAGLSDDDERWLTVLGALSALALVALIGVVNAPLPELFDVPTAAERAIATKYIAEAPKPITPQKRAQSERREAPSELERAPRRAAAPQPADSAGSPRDRVDQIKAVLRGMGARGVFGQGLFARGVLDQVAAKEVAGEWPDGRLKGDGHGGGGDAPLRLGEQGMSPGIAAARAHEGRLCPPGQRCKPTVDPPQWREVEVACAADGRGCLDKELLRHVIREHLSQVRFCYEQRLSQRPTLAGKLSVRFVVEPSGAVSSAELAAASALGDELVERCVLSRVRAWLFPQSAGRSAVTYPFMLQPAGG